MSAEECEFAALMQRVREGSQDAARELYERYGTHVRRVVRRKLAKELRSKFDSCDLMQDVWASFFGDVIREHHFERPEDLRNFLARMAYNKAIEVFRQRVQTEKYDVEREQSLNDSGVFPRGTLPGRHPTPSRFVGSKEQWDRLLEGQSALNQRALVLLGQGYTVPEVARQLGVTDKTIRRLVQKLDPGSLP